MYSSVPNATDTNNWCHWLSGCLPVPLCSYHTTTAARFRFHDLLLLDRTGYSHTDGKQHVLENANPGLKEST